MARSATKQRPIETAPPVPAGGMWDPLPVPVPEPDPNSQPSAPEDGAGLPADGAPAELKRIPLAEIHESPLNPRRTYDPAKLAQLQDSLLATGQLTPVVVRPRAGGGYELGAGHRRRRAALLAVQQHPEGARYRDLDHLLALVRALDDRAFIELLNVENLQRDDLHPLEEADGFRTLMERAGYDIPKIATRIGRSTRYVYDSLTLLKLTPKAKKLYLAGAFERGHAIELARLAPTDQERALDSDRSSQYRVGGLFAPGLADTGGLALDDEHSPRKPVTVREFKRWIDDQVRFKPAAADPMLFPETVEAVGAALLAKEKVVEITYDHQVPEAARDEHAPRIYGAQAWRSATAGYPDPGYRPKDGRPCAHAITGVIVVGEGRGEAFKVCIAKERCSVHWADWQKERAKAPVRVARPSGIQPGAVPGQQAAQARTLAKQQEEAQRWGKAGPALRQALYQRIETLPVKLGGPLVAIAFQVSAKGAKTLEDLVRREARATMSRQINWDWGLRNNGPRYAKQLGVDLATILADAAPATEQKPAATKKATAKKKKKGGR